MKHFAALFLLALCTTAHGVPLLADSAQVYTRTVSTKHYELKDHLGNVRAVVSDVKEPVNAADHKQGFTAQLLSSSHYDAFGMELADRGYASAKYRYGFNGKEKDDEWKGSGNSYDFDARIYDPRVGRWLSTDPLSDKFPDQSPYDFAFNNPITFIDPDGKAPKTTVIVEKIIMENEYLGQAFSKIKGSTMYNDMIDVIYEKTGHPLVFINKKPDMSKLPETYKGKSVIWFSPPMGSNGYIKGGIDDGSLSVFVDVTHHSFGGSTSLQDYEEVIVGTEKRKGFSGQMISYNKTKSVPNGIFTITEFQPDVTYLAGAIYHEAMHQYFYAIGEYGNDHELMLTDKYRNEMIQFLIQFDYLNGTTHSAEWYEAVSYDHVGLEFDIALEKMDAEKRKKVEERNQKQYERKGRTLTKKVNTRSLNQCKNCEQRQ